MVRQPGNTEILGISSNELHLLLQSCLFSSEVVWRIYINIWSSVESNAPWWTSGYLGYFSLSFLSLILVCKTSTQYTQPEMWPDFWEIPGQRSGWFLSDLTPINLYFSVSPHSHWQTAGWGVVQSISKSQSNSSWWEMWTVLCRPTIRRVMIMWENC